MAADLPRSSFYTQIKDMEVSSPNVQMNFEDDFLCELECPVCFNYMTAPIEQCVNGHSLCVDCRRKLFLCPACRVRLTGIRNRLAENISSKLLYPCINLEAGCPLTIPRNLLTTHKRRCRYRFYNCFLKKDQLCQWIGRSTQILDHFNRNHYAHVSNGSMRFNWINIKLDQEHHSNFLISIHDEIFWCSRKVDPRNKTVSFCVQYIGAEENAQNFTYAIEFRSYKKSLKIHSTTTSDIIDVDTIFESRTCLELSAALIQSFSDNCNKVFYTLDILRNVTQ